jgi:nitrous-oxide reductase
MTVHTRWLAALSAFALVTAFTYSCAPSEPQSRRATRGATSDIALAAQKVYVAPGDLDPYYMFASGGLNRAGFFGRLIQAEDGAHTTT